MNLLIKLAWRSLWRNKRRTIITTVAIALALVLAVFVITLADGMYAKFIRGVTRMQAGNVTLQHARYLDAPAIDLLVTDVNKWRTAIDRMPEVEKTVAIIVGQGVIASGSGAVGVAVVGVDPGAERSKSPLPEKIVSGSYLADGDTRKVVIGAVLAKRLEVEVGNKVVVTTNDARGELVQQMLRVKGIFETKSVEMDGYFVQLPLGFARKVFNIPPDQATQIGVVLRDGDDQAAVLARVERLVAGAREVAALPWQKVLPDLASFMAVDKGSNLIFQGIILFLMLFTIFNTIMMSVLERTHEFGVMLAVGTSPARLKAQLLLEATMLGLLGTVVGLGIGGGLSYYFQVHGLDLSSMMSEGMDVAGFAFDPVMRPKLTASTLTWLGGIVVGATVLISLVPMSRIRRIDLAAVLR